MKYRPVGFRVLIEMQKVEQTTKSGIVLASDKEHKREEDGARTGRIVSFGPTAFQGYEGCRTDSAPKDWGVAIGDMVQFKRYDGETPQHKDYQNFRVINDADIIMVINDE